MLAKRYSPSNSTMPLIGPSMSDHSSKRVIVEKLNLRIMLSPYATHISQELAFNGKQSPRSLAFTLRTFPMVSRLSAHVSFTVFHLTTVPSP